MVDTRPFYQPWWLDTNAAKVWARDSKGDSVMLCDVRGWGYLTGRGDALGLPSDYALQIQRGIGQFIATAPDIAYEAENILGAVDRGEVIDRDHPYIVHLRACLAKSEGKK